MIFKIGDIVFCKENSKLYEITYKDNYCENQIGGDYFDNVSIYFRLATELEILLYWNKA